MEKRISNSSSSHDGGAARDRSNNADEWSNNKLKEDEPDFIIISTAVTKEFATSQIKYFSIIHSYLFMLNMYISQNIEQI